MACLTLFISSLLKLYNYYNMLHIGGLVISHLPNEIVQIFFLLNHIFVTEKYSLVIDYVHLIKFNSAQQVVVATNVFVV